VPLPPPPPVAGRGKVGGSDGAWEIPSGGRVLRYAKVVSSGQAAEAGMRKVLLRIGATSTISLLATDVYSFKSARDAASQRATGKSSTGGVIGAIGSMLGVRQSAAASPQRQASASSASSSSAEDDLHHHQQQQVVSRDEVVGALNSLLTRAGIPLAPSERNLMARIMELDSQNKRLQNDLLQERLVH
jgi:hypothetical protein